MKIRRVDLIVLLSAGLVVLLVSLLPSPRDRNPPVPNTPQHEALRSVKGCVLCHTPTGNKPLPERHPKRKDCFRCHQEPGSTIE